MPTSESKESFEIFVKCPICERNKVLKISLDHIDTDNSTSRIIIPIGAICEHSFHIFVDSKKLTIIK